MDCKGSTYRLSVDATDEADVPHVLLHLSLLVTKTCEGVDDDTEDDVEEQHDNDQHEGQVIEGTQVVDLLGLVEVGV